VVKQIPRKEYLIKLRSRLQDDVGFVINKLIERNEEEPHIGFFVMVRAIMPIIEAVATSEGRQPQLLLEDLGIGAPHVIWNLYRDIFLHNDEFVVAAVGKLGVPSGIIFTYPEDNKELSDTLAKDGLNFDPFRTQRELISYLTGKIDSSDEKSQVDIIGAVEYEEVSNNQEVVNIVSEIEQIHKAQQRGNNY